VGKIQPPALSAVEPLKTIMNNPNENSNIRWMAASALETMGQDTQGFFSQTSRKSLDTLARQECPLKWRVVNFVPFVGRCFAQGGGGGGKKVAQRLMQGRRSKISKSNRSSG
jgi:hypothetical protein